MFLQHFIISFLFFSVLYELCSFDQIVSSELIVHFLNRCGDELSTDLIPMPNDKGVFSQEEFHHLVNIKLRGVSRTIDWFLTEPLHTCLTAPEEKYLDQYSILADVTHCESIFVFDSDAHSICSLK